METSVSRYDFAPITGSETTEEGYLRVWCRAARAGIQSYRRPDGSTVREYRPPEEVANPDSVATFAMSPVTWTHPPVLLDAANTKQYLKGYSGSHARYSDGFVEVALQITDEEIIRKIQNKEATEVSAGYKVDYDATPGVTPTGEAYDGVQRNIRVNHIAIVPRGRAGPEVRLLLDRMDAADAVAIDQEDLAHQPKSLSKNKKPMALVKLDGMDIELPAEVAPAVNMFAQNMTQRVNDLNQSLTEANDRIDSLEEDLQTALTEKATAEGRCDSLEDRVAELEEGAESRIDAAELDKLVTARLTLLQRLAPAFSDDYKFDGRSDEELYNQAFTNLTGSEPPENVDPSYLVGVVDGILLTRQDADDDEDEEEGEEESEDSEEKTDSAESRTRGDSASSRTDSTERLRNAVRGARRNDNDTARARYQSKVTQAWQKPLTSTKA